MIYFIKYLLLLNNYNKYRFFIKPNKEQKEINLLLRELDGLMEKYQRDLSLDEYNLHVLNKYPDLEPLLDKIAESEIKDDIIQDTLKNLQLQQLAYELALKAIDVSEGRAPVENLVDYFDKFSHVKTPEETDNFITDDLEELYDETVHTSGLRWRLSALNRSLGSLRKGDFGFIFARPETGKTTFLASEVSHFATQTDRPILWFNNEEQGNKVKVRLYQASLGCSLAQLYSDRSKSASLFESYTGHRIRLLDSASIHRRQVERIVKEVQPALIVFDQIDKIKGFDSDREDLRLGAIYIWARELAKEYCPVIGVCQADVTGENKKWLTMDNVANAKTSKQAEADWILGIGKVHDDGLEYMRYLHLSKNKLAGDEDSEPDLRHGRIEVIIQPEIARYKDLNYESN